MEATLQFPRFANGDVTIIVSANKIYQLHSHTLHRLSPTFARLLDAYPGAKLSAAARREGATPFRFELRNQSLQGSFGVFVRIRISDNGKVMRDNDPLSLIDLGRINSQDKYWDWLFGSFYNIPPKFEDHNLATVLHDCMALVDVAESVEAIEQIREHVDLALLRQDQVLWRSIAANPTAWTELGCRLHSPTIFREGTIHLVGLWQRLQETERAEVRPEIRDLVETKWQELDVAKQAIEMRILGHYPAFLSRVHTDKPHRTSYSSDIYMWMAICFFRHWYAQCIAENRNRTSQDGGFELYNLLAQGGNAYLHHEDFRRFHQYFPMSGKACNVLEANMNVLKEEVKGFVKDIVKVRTHVKIDEFQVKWLTCAVINKEDFPWERANAALVAAQQAQVEEAMGLQHANIRSSPLTPLGALDFELPEFTGCPPDHP